MCTSFVVNKRKTLVGWNLDILDMIHRIRIDDNGVYIEIFDEKEGWLPLFGANSRGDFVGILLIFMGINLRDNQQLILSI